MTGNEARGEYTTDIAYPSAFGAFQAPIHMAYVAALGGRRAADIRGHFTYCDLGTGGGLTLCVLADCYPEAEFFGVDLNPAHVHEARALAQSAGLANVTFYEASFADLGKLALPLCDFVAMSGIYSWLTPALRLAALEWAARALSPAGQLFVHYGALPGNSQIDALYGLIRETAAGLPGDSLARFQAATAIMERMARAKAQFFETNPYAAAWLKGLPQQDQRSMAHEVLNAQPASLSIRDAADEASAHGLGYVANAQVELNHLDLVAPPALKADLLNASPIAREMMLDAIRNAHSRMDLYARSDAPVTSFGEAAAAFILDRLSRGELGAERAKLSGRSGVDFTHVIFTDLLRLIDGRAASIAAIRTHPLLAGYGDAEVTSAVQHLIATKLLHLLRYPYVHNVPEKPRIASRLNQLLLEERIEAAGQLPLASPVAGTQLLLPPADRLALLALVDGDFARAWQRIGAAGQRVKNAGTPVTDAGALERVARDRAAAVGPAMLQRLTRLGILT